MDKFHCLWQILRAFANSIQGLMFLSRKVKVSFPAYMSYSLVQFPHVSGFIYLMYQHCSSYFSCLSKFELIMSFWRLLVLTFSNQNKGGYDCNALEPFKAPINN